MAVVKHQCCGYDSQLRCELGVQFYSVLKINAQIMLEFRKLGIHIDFSLNELALDVRTAESGRLPTVDEGPISFLNT